MRIVSFYIGGFGVLTNVGLENLSGGLNLILGDNGAGKSTLLEFFRAVLFGFRDRRGALPRYEPVRGGAFGGHLVVEMANGRRYRIARSEGDRVSGLETVMALDDSSVAPSLSELLSRASRDVFENVFAFSLAELQAVASLERQEVQGRLYAAGAGTGAASAPKVREQLEKQAKEVYSSRGRSELGTVLGEARELLRRRRELAGLADEYARLKRERERQAEERVRAEEQEQLAAKELAFAEMLVAAWPEWLKLRECERDLERLGNVVPMPERAEERLEAALVAVREIQAQVAEADNRLAHTDARIRESLAALGADWTEERVNRFDTGDPIVATIREFGRELNAAAGDVTRVEAEVRTLEQAAAQAAETRTALEAEERTRWPEPPRAISSIEADIEAVRAARNEATQLVEERARRSEIDARRHDAEANVRRIREAPEPIAAPARIPLFIAVGALSCAAAVLPLNKLIALGLFAIFIIASAVAIRDQRRARALVRAQRAEEIREAEGRLRDLEDRLAAADESIRTREAALVTSLSRFGVQSVEGPTDLDPVERRLSDERDNATQYAAFARRVHDARQAEAVALDRLDEARKRLDAVQATYDAAAARWADWLRGADLPIETSVQAALELLERVRGAQALLEDRRHRLEEKERAIERLRQAEAQVEAVIHEAGDTDEATFRAHAQRWHMREQLLAQKQGLDGAMAARVGSAEQWDAIRKLLERSDEEALRTRLAQATDAYRAARDVHQQVARRQGEIDAELRRLETSEEQEQVAARLAELQTRAQELFQRWTTLSLCMKLLDEARSRFERERQPAVVKRAGEYLKSITDGRYVALIRPFAPTSSAGQSGVGRSDLLVEGPDGERKSHLQWNRGLLEQIYLCLRLAFIEDYSQSAEPLPVIMDDVLANFDPGHARRTAQTLADFSTNHQVLYLTCHPETIALMTEACPHAARFRLDDYQLVAME